ncbi:MAG: AMP-binding protein [Planctomycetaceae bacterium]|nr:AMP-binding protein [Planctomycetaceae bacterium]
MSTDSQNVARRLTAMARERLDAVAVAEPLKYNAQGRRQYRHVTFRQLDEDSDRIAAGLWQLGVRRGTKLALLVRPGIDFMSLVFGLFKAGAVAILIDPGMGRRNMIGCLAEAEPEGFIAIPLAHAVRTILRQRFPQAKFNVTVGRRWFWGGVTLTQLRRQGLGNSVPSDATVSSDDPAAIIFTTGSTGVPKGVLFTHRNFDAQAVQIRDFYGIQPGEVDLPCFPLFGLFNCAMGVTAVIPDLDPSRPAQADPAKIIEAIRDWKTTQTFGSPAIWDRVGRHCEKHKIEMPTIRRVLSAGAPIPADVLRRMRACIHPEGEIHTPYGATEALPVASIGAGEVLGETVQRTREGGGVCVGRRFASVCWKVVRVVDGPIRSLSDAEELPVGEIGELIVRGPQVTRRYVTRVDANALAKIADGESIWHRMGDCGYLDSQDRFWFCGRVAHRVLTADGPMYTVRCEAIFNRHSQVRRSALVGVGPAGRQRPVIIVEPNAPVDAEAAKQSLLAELRELGASSPLTERINDFLLHPAFPVDIRHNAKIFREKLAVWAAEQSKDR